MLFTLSHYLQRASECEKLAVQVSDPDMRAGYLEVAQRFREMAYSTGKTLTTDVEIEKLVEGMVGKMPSQSKLG